MKQTKPTKAEKRVIDAYNRGTILTGSLALVTGLSVNVCMRTKKKFDLRTNYERDHGYTY